jgi:hypothetical protein
MTTDWITNLMVELTMSYKLDSSLNDFRELIEKHLSKEDAYQAGYQKGKEDMKKERDKSARF